MTWELLKAALFCVVLLGAGFILTFRQSTPKPETAIEPELLPHEVAVVEPTHHHH